MKTSHTIHKRRLIWFFLFLPVGLSSLPGEIFAQPSTSKLNHLSVLRQDHANLRENFYSELKKLHKECMARNEPTGAKAIENILTPENHSILVMPKLPRELQADLPLSLSANERYWRSQLRRLQSEYAKDVYLLARRVLGAGHPSFAYELVLEVTRHDSDNKPARNLLGYVQYGEEWMSPFERDQLKRHYVNHPEFGWLPAAHVAKYEQGERRYRTRWISAQKESELRRSFDNAWTIRSEHYLVKTNHSLEKGVEISRALEDFHRFFRSMFPGFYNSPAQLKKLFAGGAVMRRTTSQLYEVHYFRNQDEYVGTLKHIPNIGVTNGFYYPKNRVAYFFDVPNVNTTPTLFHEATHQLLYESQGRNRDIAEAAHFWVIEGIANYMETFQRTDDAWSVGNPQFVRVFWARKRLLDENFYITFDRFSRMGLQPFQQDPVIANLRRRYSQATGLTHFFIHYDGGRYRDALIDHIAQLYSPIDRVRRNPSTMEELTGMTSLEIDRQYREYMTEQDKNADKIVIGVPMQPEESE